METPLQFALRETREETGHVTQWLYDPRLISNYEFVWFAQHYQCRTHWFVVSQVEGAKHSPAPAMLPLSPRCAGWRWKTGGCCFTIMGNYGFLSYKLSKI